MIDCIYIIITSSIVLFCERCSGNPLYKRGEWEVSLVGLPAISCYGQRCPTMFRQKCWTYANVHQCLHYLFPLASSFFVFVASLPFPPSLFSLPPSSLLPSSLLPNFGPGLILFCFVFTYSPKSHWGSSLLRFWQVWLALLTWWQPRLAVFPGWCLNFTVSKGKYSMFL